MSSLKNLNKLLIIHNTIKSGKFKGDLKYLQKKNSSNLF